MATMPMEIKITDYFTVQPTKLYITEQKPKLYPTHQKSLDPISQSYHSELTESLKAFQDKNWKPLKEKTIIPTIIKCPAPRSSKRRQNVIMSKNLLVVPAWEPPSRPRSVLSDNARPTSSYSRSRTPGVHPGNFDTLDPDTLAHLLGLDRPYSAYGDICNTPNYEDNNSFTSNKDLDEFSLDSDWSLLEDFDETEVRNVKTETEQELRLRPEQLDSLYTREDKRERTQYDFDASKTLIPPYEYKEVLPKGSRYLDFSVIAKQGLDWRNLTEMPRSDVIFKLFDRFVDLERLQNDTIARESRKTRPVSRRNPLVRSHSAKTRDKKCCSTCLQVACVGDCPEKSRCSLCHQPLPNDVISASYDTHMRYLAVDECSAYPSQYKNKLCPSCSRRQNPSPNSPLLGRPKSSNATFNRGRNTVRSTEIRPKSAVEHSSKTIQQFENLGLDPTQSPSHSPSRPSTAVSSRPRSRNGLLPGKSCSSNRKISISDPKYKTVNCRVRTRSPKLKLNYNMI